ncbi:MAG: GAF domain-containing sensor histidine kinase [SAR324 cluster bacterium]|nr:GAF domain-containing sensor histidine kinase [SAR324 cluster bacterium]
MVAIQGGKPAFVDFLRPNPIIRGTPNTALGRLESELRPIHIADMTAEDAYREGKPHRVAVADLEGARSFLAVPMLKEGQLVGAITIYRREVRPFTDKQIALVETFADQGVIAIENVRLFNELQASTRELARSVEELQALAEVGQAVSSTLDQQTVLTTIVTRAVQISGTEGGVIYEYDEGDQAFHPMAAHGVDEKLMSNLQAGPTQLGESAMGRAALSRAPFQVPDLRDEGSIVLPRVRSELVQSGYRSLLAVPLLLEERIMGGLVVWRKEPGEFAEEVVQLLQTFATQSSLAIQNARLFFEIEERGRQLEIASRHKSQFLANMSHELRTPLNAILGYTELILDRIYGEVPDKVTEVLDRVTVSGNHLLGLINNVLDLAKIEAGQLDLSLADYSMKDVVQNVSVAVESLAAEKRLALNVEVSDGLPVGRGDEQRITQVLLNLAGNAIKFCEAGSVGIRVSAEDGAFLIAVSDTGPGITKSEQEEIFGEFHQADSSTSKKKGGTGLGLAIARKFVEMHGGRIWVDSDPGKGSTFWFTLPIRAEQQREGV